MSLGAPLSGARATAILGGIALRRLVRGKTLWIAGLLALCPVIIAAVLGRRDREANWHETYNLLVVFMVVVPPLVVASAVSDEIEDRTYTYLWSRPLPRWSMVAGKLVAGWPVAAAILAASAWASFQLISGHGDVPPGALGRGLLGCAVGVLGTSLVSAGFAALAPALAQRITYAYLFVDLVLGNIDFSLRELSVTHHIRQLAGVADPGTSPLGDAVWCIALGLFWLVIGLIRLGRAEYAADR